MRNTITYALIYLLTFVSCEDTSDCCEPPPPPPDTPHFIALYSIPNALNFSYSEQSKRFNVGLNSEKDYTQNDEGYYKYAKLYGDTSFNRSYVDAECLLDTIESLNIYCSKSFLDKDSAASLNDYFLTSFYTHYYFIQSGYDRTIVDRLYFRTITEFNNEPIKHLFEPGCMIKFSDSLDLSGLSGPYRFTLEYNSLNGTTYTSSATVDF